ncbi:MAG: hypothetical protein ACOX3U_07985 [Christensenellales bacterium]
MAIQTTFNKIKSDYIEKILSAQVVVKATLDTSSDNGVILGTSADARALAIEPLEGEVQINGKVNFKTVFASNDNGVISLDYFADFTDTLKDENITPSSKLIMKLNVVDTDSALSGQDIILTAVVDIEVDEIKSAEYEALAATDENVLTKENVINTDNLKSVVEGAFEIYEEIEAGGEIDKILVYDVQTVVNSSKCGLNTLIVSGEAHAAVSFRTGNEIMVKNLVIPFNEELDAEGANAECMPDPELYIKNKRIILSGAKDDNLIRAEMVIGVKAPIFEKVSNKVVTDLYSNEYNLDKEESVIKCKEVVLKNCYKEKISAVATLDSEMKAVKNILAVCLTRNNLANLIPSDGEITAEGLMTACVLYIDQEDKITSVRAELPYSLKLIDDNVKEKDSASGYGCVYNVNAKALSANEIEVKADIKLCISISREKESKIITKCEEKDKKESKLNAISMYIAKGGEEMWDLVKNLSAHPDDIVKQNPNIELPLARGNRVKIFRRI